MLYTGSGAGVGVEYSAGVLYTGSGAGVEYSFGVLLASGVL